MQTGERYGKYMLLHRIAYGGMAEIFKGKAIGAAGFEKNVAIKRLHSRYAEDRDVIIMLQDEARIVSQLNHQNICQVMDLGRVDDTYYIAMEFIDGADLATTMRRAEKIFPRALPYPATLFIMSEILSGLDFAHRRTDGEGNSLGIIHRDISPQNVLISMEGEVKIIDFGIAKAKGQSHKTEAGVIKGKYRYMSPEQARGERIDHRTDVFSAGVVFYELILGHPHSRGLTDMQVLARIQQGYLDPLDQLIPDLPAEITEMIDVALAPDPENRWTSAGHFKRSIDSFSRVNGFEFNRDSLCELMRRLFPERSVQKKLSAATKPAKPGDLVLESNLGMTQELGIDQVIEVSPLEENVDPAEAATALAGPLSGYAARKEPLVNQKIPLRPAKQAGQRPYRDPRKNRKRSAVDNDPVLPVNAGFPPNVAPTAAVLTDPGLKAAWDAHQESKSPPPPERSPDPPPPKSHFPSPEKSRVQPVVDPPDFGDTTEQDQNHEDLTEPKRIKGRSKSGFKSKKKKKRTAETAPDKDRSESTLGGTLLYAFIILLLLGGAGYVGYQYMQSLKEDKRTDGSETDYGSGESPKLIKTTLDVSTEPENGALILVNGRSTGARTPSVIDLQAPSPVVVELVKQGYPRWVNEFHLTPGEPLRIEADLRRPPGAEISSKKPARPRKTRRTKTKRGPRPEPSHPSRQDDETGGAVYGPGLEETGKGIVTIRSPDKGWVYINNQRMGVSPYTATLNPGSYTIQLRRGEQSSPPMHITVKSGTKRNISLKLK